MSDLPIGAVLMESVWRVSQSDSENMWLRLNEMGPLAPPQRWLCKHSRARTPPSALLPSGNQARGRVHTATYPPSKLSSPSQKQKNHRKMEINKAMLGTQRKCFRWKKLVSSPRNPLTRRAHTDFGHLEELVRAHCDASLAMFRARVT